MADHGQPGIPVSQLRAQARPEFTVRSVLVGIFVAALVLAFVLLKYYGISLAGGGGH
jgi:hypothetical protein